MSFAKNHMYKQGWVEGKGLGRYETGMKSAIKVKIKRDQAGMGHDMAEEFTFQWWDHVFNKAASKIKLKGEDDSEDSSSDDEDTAASSNGGSLDITNKKPTKKKYDPKQILYGRFVSGGLLVDENSVRLREMMDVVIDSGGGVVVPATAPTSVISDDVDDDSSDSDDDEAMKLYAAAGLPEEELLKRCGGRTAHKGARHGLKASAKLERIERQEGSAKVSGASTPVTAPSSPVPATTPISASSLPDVTPILGKVKKSKKRESEPEAATPTEAPPTKKRKKTKKRSTEDVPVVLPQTTESGTPIEKKKKKKKLTEERKDDASPLIESIHPVEILSPVETVDNFEMVKEKKKKKKAAKNTVALREGTNDISVTPNPLEIPMAASDVGAERKKSKKKKKKDGYEASTISTAPSIVSDDLVMVSSEAVDVDKKKKKKKAKTELVLAEIPVSKEVVVEKREKRKKQKKTSD